MHVGKQQSAKEADTSFKVVSSDNRQIMVDVAPSDGSDTFEVSVEKKYFNFAGNPFYAPAECLRSAVASQLEAASRPKTVFDRFRDIDEATFSEHADEVLTALNQGLKPPTADEPHVFYTGYRALTTAQSQVDKPGPMFVTASVEEAHGYAHRGSVVLKWCATSTANQTDDNEYGLPEYTTRAAARADGVRLCGAIQGRGERGFARSVIAGAFYE